MTPLDSTISSPSVSSMQSQGSSEKAYLISPVWDSMLIGGASMIVFALYWLFVDPAASVASIVTLTFGLSFLVNSPHFMASYQMLYVDYRHLLFKKKSFFWAAFGAPVLIISALAYGALSANIAFLGLMAQIMYLSVGWHYVKQIYGTAIVTSAVQKHYFSKTERALLLINLNSVWLMSWASANQVHGKTSLDGIMFFNLGLPSAFVQGAYWLTGISFLLVVAATVRTYIQTGRRPATASIVGFFTIYCWYIPTLYHPVFFWLIPFFHSLQYMLFVVALKKNQAAHAASHEADAVRSRAKFMKTLGGFFLIAIITGALSFEFIPKNLDKLVPFEAALFGSTFWMFMVGIFINLHHYFIDNVIWRGDNEALKIHLVQASRERAMKRA